MKLSRITAASAFALASSLALSTPAHAQAGTQFVGQVSAFGFNFCPRGWAGAEGQLLPIAQNTALFSLYGTIYGGDGRTTFALPDLRGRRPVGQGNGPGLGTYREGQAGGSTSFVLTTLNLPSHSHTGSLGANRTFGNTDQPVDNSFARAPNGVNMHRRGAPAVNNMNSGTLRIQNSGGGQAVSKQSPFQVVRWCVALQGIYPSRN